MVVFYRVLVCSALSLSLEFQTTKRHAHKHRHWYTAAAHRCLRHLAHRRRPFLPLQQSRCLRNRNQQKRHCHSRANGSARGSVFICSLPKRRRRRRRFCVSLSHCFDSRRSEGLRLFNQQQNSIFCWQRIHPLLAGSWDEGRWQCVSLVLCKRYEASSVNNLARLTNTYLHRIGCLSVRIVQSALTKQRLFNLRVHVLGDVVQVGRSVQPLPISLALSRDISFCLHFATAIAKFCCIWCC